MQNKMFLPDFSPDFSPDKSWNEKQGCPTFIHPLCATRLELQGPNSNLATFREVSTAIQNSKPKGIQKTPVLRKSQRVTIPTKRLDL